MTRVRPALQGHASPATVAAHLHGRRWHLRLKRAADVGLSAALLIMLSPVLLLTAVLIRMESPGPVLFIQPRWGWKGCVFWCLKFRSMHQHDSPEGRPGVRDGSLAKMRGDPRVSRVGRFIRRTSIDELPQLWNVLRGEMSLVGPRPLVLGMLEPYPEIREVRGHLRPGMTGLWQITDRANNTHVSAMLPYDTEYLARVTIWFDLRILLRTVRVVVTGHGAH